MERDKIEEAIEKSIMSDVTNRALELVDVEYIQDGAYYYLRVYVEKENGEMDLEDCAQLSHDIEAKVDAIIEDKFFLEVSSPGLERSLKKEKDYIRFIGKKIKVLLKNKIEDTRNCTGYLVKFDEGKVYLEINEIIHEINFNDIKKANLVFEFSDF